jgi:septum formation protein
VLEAYVDSGEGLDRAGGYAIQQLGGLLVQRIEGSYDTVVGFPGHAFVTFLSAMLDEEEVFDVDM